MLMQIDAEKTDTLAACIASAIGVAKAIGINVLFYFDRKGYLVTPTDTPATVMARESKQ